MATPPADVFPSSSRVIFVADLAGFAISFRTHSDAEMAALLDRFYAVAERVITGHEGRIVKFMGDAVLAVFADDHAPRAVAAAVTLEASVPELSREMAIPLQVGVNIHHGAVIEAELGHGTMRRWDVVGRVVNQTFLLGSGAGIRVSEPVYRKLPSADRTPWTKNRPPVVYSLGAGGAVYEGLRKSAIQNALRW